MEPLDDLDRRILHELQLDSRRTTEPTSPRRPGRQGPRSHRSRTLEARGLIQGYYPSIDYEAAGYPLSVLFTCTVPLAERSAIAERALEVTGVTGVRETMASQQHGQVFVVGDSKRRIERLTTRLADLGLEIVRSYLLAHERVQPWDHFHLEALDDDPEGEEGTADTTGFDTPDDR